MSDAMERKSYQLLIDVWLQLHQVMDSSVNHVARLVVNSHSMCIQILFYSLAALVTTLKGGGVSWFHHVHPSVDKVKFLYSSIYTIICSTMITFNTYKMYVALDLRRITIIVFHAQGQTWAIIQMYNSSDFRVCIHIYCRHDHWQKLSSLVPWSDLDLWPSSSVLGAVTTFSLGLMLIKVKVTGENIQLAILTHCDSVISSLHLCCF